MSNEWGYLVWIVLALGVEILAGLVAAFALIAWRRAERESERWRTAFEDSESDLQNVIARRDELVNRAVRLGLILDDAPEPLIIGGTSAGEKNAIWAKYDPGNVGESRDSKKNGN